MPDLLSFQDKNINLQLDVKFPDLKKKKMLATDFKNIQQASILQASKQVPGPEVPPGRERPEDAICLKGHP